MIYKKIHFYERQIFSYSPSVCMSQDALCCHLLWIHLKTHSTMNFSFTDILSNKRHMAPISIVDNNITVEHLRITKEP